MPRTSASPLAYARRSTTLRGAVVVSATRSPNCRRHQRTSDGAAYRRGDPAAWISESSSVARTAESASPWPSTEATSVGVCHVPLRARRA